ncbi:unnamed protein product [Orchesella dallaii]|uniref:Transmembrane protein n=1 Tax=Orchesella dallaii TaxID=48710 RepID=A0ABP1S331_9HEXA
MSSTLRMLASRIPTFSLKGVAYLAAANFLARALILVRHYIVTYFHSEMILIYGATLDTRILLFFQAIYMIPMFLLGVLVFFGIDRESFNLVLYPTLMLLFLILIRYGSEAALLVVHWEEHKLEQTPELVFSLVQDVVFICLLLLYIYVCLAFTPIKPTPLELLEGGNTALASAAAAQGNLIPVQASVQQQQLPQGLVPSTSQPQQPSSQLQIPQNNLAVAATIPDSQGFNYALRRNIGQIPKDSTDKAMLDDIERQRQRNSLILREKELNEQGKLAGSSNTTGVIETDLDAIPISALLAAAAFCEKKPSTEPAPVATAATTPAEESPPTVAKPKMSKTMLKAAREAALAANKKDPEKQPEPEVDFWGSSNGDGDANASAATKPDGCKTTSV